MFPSDIPYTRGLHRLGDHTHAWLVPDGTWGWSNAGVVTGEGESLLVDTLFDLAMTREMLDGLRPVTEDHPIRTVVNTHANGDHWFGNELVADEDVAVVTGEARADLKAASAPLLFGARLSYYDAIERDTSVEVLEHDFRTADGSLSLTLLGEGDQRVSLAVGARTFVYKPDPRYDFMGEHLDLSWRGRWVSDDEGRTWWLEQHIHATRTG